MKTTSSRIAIIASFVALAVISLWIFRKIHATELARKGATPETVLKKSAILPVRSPGEIKRLEFAQAMTELTSKQGWRFVIEDQGGEGLSLVVYGYVDASKGILLSGRMNHSTIDGDLFMPTGERNAEKPDFVSPAYYRGSPLNSLKNCTFYRAQGFTTIEARNIHSEKSWDLCGHWWPSESKAGETRK